MSTEIQHEEKNDINGGVSSKKGYRKIVLVTVAFLVVVVFRASILERIIIDGNSMYPTLKNEDVCFASKVNIEPRRYDIVTANVNGKSIVKRVVGIPGDVLYVKDGILYINGNPSLQEYNFITEESGLLSDEYFVGDNEYFLLGDNRAESNDSRVFGAVPIDQIKGIVVVRIFPGIEVMTYSP